MYPPHAAFWRHSPGPNDSQTRTDNCETYGGPYIWGLSCPYVNWTTIDQQMLAALDVTWDVLAKDYRRVFNRPFKVILAAKPQSILHP
jgi:hypothetical protein